MEIKLRTLVFLLVLFLVALFAAVNWPLLMEMDRISLVFATVLAPLGLVMLAILGGVTLLYLIFLGKAEAGALLGHRRTTKELEEARKLALSAEESRIRELRVEVEERLERIERGMNELLARAEVGRDRPVVVREEVTMTEPVRREEII